MQAMHIVEETIKIIDVEQFKTITPESGENEYFEKLRVQLNQLREMNNLDYLYTISRRETNNGYEYFYVVDGLPKEEASALGEIEPEAHKFDLMIKAFETKETQVGELGVSDQWGALVSSYSPILDKEGNIIAVLGADYNATAIYDLMQINKSQMILFIVLLILIITVIIYFISSILVKHLTKLQNVMVEVSKGNLDIQLTSNRKDEIGHLIQSFNQMTTGLKTIIDGVNYASHEIKNSAENLSIHSNKAASDMHTIAENIDKMVADTNEQKNHILHTNDTIVQMRTALQLIASSLDNTVDATQHIRNLSTKGRERMSEATVQMNKINEKQTHSLQLIQELGTTSKEIHKVVTFISEISEQTNLLALNAAIEAARAGEKGKGFAVVSQEVRNLAVQARQSAKNIEELIKTIFEKMDLVMKAMNDSTNEVVYGKSILAKTGDSFYEIIEEITNISGRVESISASTEELSSSSDEVVHSVDEVHQISERNFQKITHLSNFIQQQSDSANKLNDSTYRLFTLSEKMDELISQIFHKN